MNEKFKNKYRTHSTRLQQWDYRWDGIYFITICTHHHESYFGEIINGEMLLSPLGVIANILWYEIKNHAKHIELDDFVVMPNHIHGILILSENQPKLETRHTLSLPNIGENRFQNQGKNSISSIIGAYKSAVTKHANRLNFPFAWQSRFYDNIIRNEKSYQKIKEYVQNNPIRWKEDKFFKQN